MIRLDRLQAALSEAMSGTADAVQWSYSEQPRSVGSLLVMNVFAGPELAQRHARGYLVQPAESLTLQVTGAAAPMRNIVRLNGFDYKHDTGPEDTATTVRDALLSELTQEWGEGGIEFAAVGTDEIWLVADALAAIRSLEIGGELAADDVVLSDDFAEVTDGHATIVVQMQAFARGKSPRHGALPVLLAALDRLQQTERNSLLNAWGVGLQGWSSPINISGVAGAEWESRFSTDVRFSMVNTTIAPAYVIDRLVIGFTVGQIQLPDLTVENPE